MTNSWKRRHYQKLQHENYPSGVKNVEKIFTVKVKKESDDLLLCVLKEYRLTAKDSQKQREQNRHHRNCKKKVKDEEEVHILKSWWLTGRERREREAESKIPSDASVYAELIFRQCISWLSDVKRRRVNRIFSFIRRKESQNLQQQCYSISVDKRRGVKSFKLKRTVFFLDKWQEEGSEEDWKRKFLEGRESDANSNIMRLFGSKIRRRD